MVLRARRIRARRIDQGQHGHLEQFSRQIGLLHQFSHRILGSRNTKRVTLSARSLQRIEPIKDEKAVDGIQAGTSEKQVFRKL